MTASTQPDPSGQQRSLESQWTLADERAAARRAQRNDLSVRFASIVSASAIVLGAVLSFVSVMDATDSEIPNQPVDQLAMTTDEVTAALSFESAAIAGVALPAIDLIRFPWRSELQGWTITFLEPRGRASGYTWSNERKIEVFVRDGDDSARVARVLAHELGHAVDVTLNSSDERRAWLVEREAAPETEWWPGSGRPDFETGAGDFAEVFAAWQIGDDDFKSRVNPTIDDGDLELLSRLSLRTAEDP